MKKKIYCRKNNLDGFISSSFSNDFPKTKFIFLIFSYYFKYYKQTLFYLEALKYILHKYHTTVTP